MMKIYFKTCKIIIINTKKINKMKILSNATVTKLRENKKSYGAPEMIEVSFIKEFDNEIQLFNSFGSHQRTLRKGTKLLKSFSGNKITERTFKKKKKKNLQKNRENIKIEAEAAQKKANDEKNLIRSYADLIETVKDEDYQVTAGRLSARLYSKIDYKIFHKAVQMIRNRKK